MFRRIRSAVGYLLIFDKIGTVLPRLGMVGRDWM